MVEANSGDLEGEVVGHLMSAVKVTTCLQALAALFPLQDEEIEPGSRAAALTMIAKELDAVLSAWEQESRTAALLFTSAAAAIGPVDCGSTVAGNSHTAVRTLAAAAVRPFKSVGFDEELIDQDLSDRSRRVRFEVRIEGAGESLDQVSRTYDTLRARCSQEHASALLHLGAILREPEGPAVGTRKFGVPGQPPARTVHDPDEFLVTLQQMATIAHKKKKTLERLYAKGDLPAPERHGGGGDAHLFRWGDVRDILERQYGHKMPERYPSDLGGISEPM